MAKGASGIKSGNSLQKHFDKENARVNAFMNGKSGSIEMDNGQILEKYSIKYMMNYILKVAKENGGLESNDDAIFIRYNNGDIATYIGGDDAGIDKMKLTGISGVIYENASTSAYAGKGIEIVNYKELYPNDYPDAKGYEDDWRIDFTRSR